MEQTEYLSRKTGYKQLIAVSLGHFTNDFFAGLISPITVFFAYKMGLNFTQQGLLSIVMLIFASFLQPFLGILSDKRGKPGHLIISIIWITIWISLSGIVSHYYLLIIVLALGSSASALYHTLGTTTAVAVGGNSKGTSLSVFMTVGGFAGTFASIVGIGIAENFGVEKIFFLIIPGCVIALIMFLLGIQHVAIETEENNRIKLQNPVKEKIKMSKANKLWLSILLYISIMKTLSGVFIVTYGIQIMMLKNFAYAAMLLSIHLLGRPIGTMIGGMLIDVIGEKKVFLYGMGATFISFFMVAYGGSIATALGIGALGFSISFTNTVCVLASHEMIPNGQSFATGIIMGIPGGIGSLSMMIFSGMADAVGLIYSTRALIIPMALAMLLSFAFGFNKK